MGHGTLVLFILLGRVWGTREKHRFPESAQTGPVIRVSQGARFSLSAFAHCRTLQAKPGLQEGGCFPGMFL